MSILAHAASAHGKTVTGVANQSKSYLLLPAKSSWAPFIAGNPAVKIFPSVAAVGT